MDPSAVWQAPLWPMVLYFICVLLVVTGMIVISWLVGQRHREPSTVIPFESGMLPTGSARRRVSVQFYMIAMFFVIFDLEAVFLFAWAVAVRQLGWAGFIEALVFIVVLLAGLVYLWGQGTLNWGGRQASQLPAPHPRAGTESAMRGDVIM